MDKSTVVKNYAIDKAQPIQPLPHDLIGHLVQFLPSLKLKFRLALTSTENMFFVPNKIYSYEEPWIRKPGSKRWWSILNKLPSVTSLTVQIPFELAWHSFKDQLFRVAPTLRELKIVCRNADASPLIQDELLYSNALSFPNVERLDITLREVGPTMLRPFPNLKELSVCSLEILPKPFIPLLVDICPNLTSLVLHQFTDSEKLDAAKMLKKLKRLTVDLDVGDPMILPTTTAQMLDFLKQYITFIEAHSPVGLNLLCTAGRDGLFDMVVDRIFSVPRLRDMLKQIDVIQLLIDNGADLGAPINFSYSGFPPGSFSRLEVIIPYISSIKMFQLLFETKMMNNNTMTVLEYTKSQHPDWPFFWAAPFFSMLVVASGRSFEVLEYVAENRERLLPLFDSRDSILGGPTISSELFGSSPTQFIETLEEMKLFAKHGVDPWAEDEHGNDILSRGIFHWTEESADYMLNHPTFDPIFVDRNADSWLDRALQMDPVEEELILGLLKTKTLLITENTPELLLEALENQLDAFPTVLQVLLRLEPQSIKEIMPRLIQVHCPNDHVGVLGDFVMQNLTSVLDIPSLELSLSQDGSWNLLYCCSASKTTTSLDALVKLVKASPLCKQVFDAWQPYAISWKQTN